MRPPLLLWIVSFSANSLHGATLTLNQLSNSYSSKGGQLKSVQIGHLRNQRLEIWWKRSEGTQWEGGSQRGRKGSWMFKSLFEKPSRAHVQSVRKHDHLVARQWLLTTEGKSGGELVPAIFFFFLRTLMPFPFFWRSENASFMPTPTLRPFLLPSTQGQDPGSEKKAVGSEDPCSLPSFLWVWVKLGLRKTGERIPSVLLNEANTFLHFHMITHSYPQKKLNNNNKKRPILFLLQHSWRQDGIVC